MENVGQNVRVLGGAEVTRLVGGHGDADALEEVADGESVPVGEEIAADERGRGFAASERVAMAAGTHDNDTTNGWAGHLSDGERWMLNRYLSHRGGDLAWDLMRLAWSSV